MALSRILLLTSLAIGLLIPQIVEADPLEFSIDPASPSISGDITPDDLLIVGPQVEISGTTLGLRDSFSSGDYDNLADFSRGQDPLSRTLYFSVDRLALGLPGSAVYERAQSVFEGPAGDIYRTSIPLGTNLLAIDKLALGLTPGFFGDDLDGLSLIEGERLYFTIDAFSASNGFGTQDFAKDVFYDDLSNVFADGQSTIGLLSHDAIDGLILFDQGVRGVLEPGLDVALFSLSSYSPSTFTFTGLPYTAGVQGSLSPADILFTNFTGNYSLWLAAAKIGLRPEDNVDALATETQTVPEPAAWLLCTLGAIVYGRCRLISHRKGNAVRLGI